MTIILLSCGKQTSKAPIEKAQDSSNQGDSIYEQPNGVMFARIVLVSWLTLATLCIKWNPLVCDLYNGLTCTYWQGDQYMNLNNLGYVVFVLSSKCCVGELNHTQA